MHRDYKDSLARQLALHFSELENRILSDIIRRIKKTGEITSTADWQINRLRDLGKSAEEIESAIKDALGASYPEMFELYDKVLEKEYTRNKEIYEQVNAKYVAYEDNGELQQKVEGLIEQTKGELENMTQSLGFYVDYGNGRRVMTPLSQIYGRYLDAACMDILSGAFDYSSVIKRTVTQLTNSGLRTIDYSSGVHARVEVAARRSLMTGISQLTGKIADMQARDLKTDYFEVAWHAGARPEHATWQGKVWSRKQLYSVCGLGTVTGLLGANCYHEYYPFFPGISERTWTDEWLQEQNARESSPKEFMGKEYTAYQARQRQRQLELAMRVQRQKIRLMEEAKADPMDIMLMKCRYQGQMDEYVRFSRKMGLKQERERIYVDGLGRVAPNKRKGILKNYGQISVREVLDSKKEDSHLIKQATDKQISLLKKYGNLESLMIHGVGDDLDTWIEASKKTGLSEKTILGKLAEDVDEWSNIILAQSDQHMKKYTEQLLDTATDEELKALRYWSGPSYAKINLYERSGVNVGEVAKNASHKIEAVLSRLEIPEDLIVKRGTRTKEIFEKMPKGWQEDLSLLQGKSFVDKGYTAVSPFEDGGFSGKGEGNAKLYIRVPKGTHGAYIQSVAYNENEKELLLQKGYTYRIIKAEYVQDKKFEDEKDLIVYAEVLLND